MPRGENTESGKKGFQPTDRTPTSPTTKPQSPSSSPSLLPGGNPLQTVTEHVQHTFGIPAVDMYDNRVTELFTRMVAEAAETRRAAHADAIRATRRAETTRRDHATIATAYAQHILNQPDSNKRTAAALTIMTSNDFGTADAQKLAMSTLINDTRTMLNPADQPAIRTVGLMGTNEPASTQQKTPVYPTLGLHADAAYNAETVAATAAATVNRWGEHTPMPDEVYMNVRSGRGSGHIMYTRSTGIATARTYPVETADSLINRSSPQFTGTLTETYAWFSNLNK